MRTNNDDQAGLNPDGGVYRTSASLPRAFLGQAESATGPRRNVALAVLFAAASSSVAIVLLGLLLSHPAGDVQVARIREIVP